MEWLLLTGLLFDGSGAVLLLVSDLPEGPVKKAFYGMNAAIAHCTSLRRKLAEEWNQSKRDATRFDNLTDSEKQVMYSIVRHRELSVPETEVAEVYFEKPYLVFELRGESGFKTPCYTSPRRMLVNRMDLAVNHFFSRIGAALLLTGFVMQILYVLVR